MAGRLEGKVGIVTGAASGIGEATAELMAREGAAVVIADLQDELGESVAARIRDAGGRAMFRHLDVTSEESWIDGIAAVKAEFGGLNILVNNAGVGKDSPIVDMPFEVWRLQMAVNLDGMFLGMKHAVPLIREVPGGSVINLSSAASRKPVANMSAYGGSRAGITMVTKIAALEFAKYDNPVRVNSIHPGTIATPAWKNLGNISGQAGGPPDLEAYVKATLPLRIVGQPIDVANMILFIVSDDGRFITGGDFLVDGGRSIT